MDFRKLQRRAENFRDLLNCNRSEELRFMERERERKRGVRNGLVFGTIIGGLAGLLFAPDTGENTRKRTKEELGRIKENLEYGIEESREKLTDKIEVIENKIISLKEKGNINCAIEETCVIDDIED